MTPQQQRDLVLAAHDKLCAAMAAKNAKVLVAQFCADAVDVWGLENGDSAHSAEDLVAWASRLRATPYLFRFEWTDRTALADAKVAWLTAVGTLRVISQDFVESRPFEMTGVLLDVQNQWRWRLLSASEPTLPPDDLSVPDAAP